MDVPDKLVVQDASGQQTIELNGHTGDITAGGNGKTGDLLVNDKDGKPRVRVGWITETGHSVPGQPGLPVIAEYWGLKVQNGAGTNVVQLGRAPKLKLEQLVDSSTVSFILGGGGHTGIIEVLSTGAQSRVRLGKGDPENNTVLELRNASNQQTVSLEAGVPTQIMGETRPAGALVGGNGTNGIVMVFSSAGDNSTKDQATVVLTGNGGHITLKSNDHKDRVFIDGSKANIWLGGKDDGGAIMLFHKDEQNNRDTSKATVQLSGSSGELTLRSPAGEDRIVIDGPNGDIWLGGKDAHGAIMLFHKDQQNNRDLSKATIRLKAESGELTLRSPAGEDRVVIDASHGDIWLGGKNANGDIMLFHKDEHNNRDSSKATIRLNGEAGDIVLRNADCAEDFDIVDDAAAEPGSVMVIDSDGRLRPSSRPYDRCVAGVISGAGDLKPGIVLGRQPAASARRPVALVGRVWCRAEASGAPIETGDLLTTSSIPGCAMKALEPSRAFGAVIGKALAPLAEGRGLIPVLIALQ